MNCKVEIQGKSFYSPSLKDVAGLESIQLCTSANKNFCLVS